MNRLLDDDDLSSRSYARRPAGADREISLGTPTILGIFFALALVCACFFGFGYTLGRKSQIPQPAPSADAATESQSAINSPKPAAGSLAATPAVADSSPSSAPTGTAPAQTATVSLTPTSTPRNTVTPADGMIVGDKPVPVSQPATDNLQSATAFMVQVAAVSTQDVADIEVAALKKDGYAVLVRHEPQDKLLHVQIGPFPDRKDAEAMRTRVLADGFNAIVK